MSSTLPGYRGVDDALDALVGRGTITAEQRDAIMAELGRVTAEPGAAPSGPPAHRRRSVSEVLIEVGLYVGSALVLAAAFALVAQSWEDLGTSAQVAILAVTALVTAAVGSALARGAGAGTARRRLSGVVLVGSAASAAGTVGVILGDAAATGVAAFATALVVMLVARALAPSAVTEIGLFAASYGLMVTLGEWARPESVPRFDEFGNEVWQTTTYERLMPLGMVAFGLAWAGLVGRWLMHRELAVALGMAVAFLGAMPLAGEDETRLLGLATLAVLAAVGFWRFMAEGFWPWLAAAIASVTAFVFWAVGGGRSPALAFLVAGLVLLGSSALGWQVARRRRASHAPGPASHPVPTAQSDTRDAT